MSKKARYDLLQSLSDKNKDLMLAAERHIWKNPETGYREWKTHAYLKAEFEKLSYTVTEAGNIPGFFTDVDTGRPGPKLCIFGELDSLIVANHPECDPETGYVHACGHHAQCAALLGIAAVLKEPGALDGLSGSIRLMAVPAEELIEIGYREGLRQAGTIRYYGGKVEFMYRGFLDDVDLAFMVHTTGRLGDATYHVEDGSNGCVAKTIGFQGVSSHAGGAPHKGVNALYMASTAMQTVNSLRETFVDEDHIRFHPIVTRGGGAVNAIPHDVMLESYVRGASMDAIINQNRRINRALAASAAAFGGNVALCDRPGYSPLYNSPEITKLAVDSITEAMGEGVISSGGWSTGCTDMGDISQVMPALHPYCAGAAGTGHGNDYIIADPYTAVVGSCKLQVILLDALLGNEAAEAKQVMATTKVAFPNKADFFKTIDQMFLDKQAVIYGEDGNVSLDIVPDVK